jgi:transposase
MVCQVLSYRERPDAPVEGGRPRSGDRTLLCPAQLPGAPHALATNGLIGINSNLLANVQQKTIEPFIKDTIDPGTRVYTDEYSIYARLCAWGYDHKSVNHGRGEFARDDDGDGVCEVHVNTMEGFWSLLRSWLRPHRGISQEKLPLYLGFFEFVHNVHKRGKALLPTLIELLVT